MSPIQLLIVLFVAFALSRTLWQLKKRSISISWFILWTVFWLAAGVVAVLPQTADMLARILGVGRGADVVTYVSLAALFYLIFRLYVKIEQLESAITKVVRREALESLPADDQAKKT